MAYQAIPPSTSDLLPASIALNRARALLGTTITAVIGNHFDNAQYHATTGSAGTGATSLSTTDRAGVIKLTSGGTNGGVANVVARDTTSLISNPKTTLYYCIHRAALTSAGDASSQQTLNLFSTSGGSPQFLLGQFGSVDATHASYAVYSNAAAQIAAATSTIVLDTNFHDWEIYCDATTLTFAVDKVTVGTVATSLANFPTNPMTWGATVAQGVSAARTMSIDYTYVCMAGN